MNLCSSCTNIRCEFQSGIVRKECAFYMPPHIEPDNCGNYDVISRQAVLSKKIYTETENGWSGYTVDADYIEHLPPVTPQENTGHWINKDVRKEEYVLTGKCSVCGQVRVIDEFCSHCGAKMIESQEKRCADCSHYGKLSLDCGRCDDDCSMYEPQESEESDADSD